MDAVTDPHVTDITLMTSAQIGKSEVLLNILGYLMHQDPGPILMLQPTLEMAEAFSKDRLATMLRDTPALRGLVKDARARDSGNTLLHKQFPGGHVTLAGANSPASLASRPIRTVLADEVDRYPISAGTEGDPLSLAEKRTATFWNRKRIKVSTPTVKGASRIEASYLTSDQRRFWVPCCHCGEHQVLEWKHVRWPEGQPERATYVCPHCAAEIDDHQRAMMVRVGEWRASAEFKGHAGFHINELYSPWRTVGEIATDFVKAKAFVEQLKTWVNTSLGETWEDSTAVLAGSELADRAEPYRLRTAPAGVLLLTGSVDTQNDRLEVSIWGYGRGEQAWMLDRAVFQGDPDKPAVWNDVLEYFARPIQHEEGALAVPSVVMIDSGGSKTQAVYAFCRRNERRNLGVLGRQQFLAIKGSSESKAPIVGKPKPVDLTVNGAQIRNGVKLWPVGSSEAKSLIYGRLKLSEPGPGFVHFSQDLEDDFYEQLTAERLVTRYVRGFAKVEWFLPSGRRNEALDLAVYALAAAYQQGMARYTDADWDVLEQQLAARTPQRVDAPPPAPAAAPKPARRQVSNGFGSSDWAERF